MAVTTSNLSSKPTSLISNCGCPKNPPSLITVMVAASKNTVNYLIGLTKPSGVVS